MKSGTLPTKPKKSGNLKVSCKDPLMIGPKVLPISLIEVLVPVIEAILSLEEEAKSKVILVTFMPEMKKSAETRTPIKSGILTFPTTKERAANVAADEVEENVMTLLYPTLLTKLPKRGPPTRRTREMGAMVSPVSSMFSPYPTGLGSSNRKTSD